MASRRFSSDIARRDFLRYAGYSGMAVSMASVLAACREAETPSGGTQGSAQASIPPMEQEPGSLQVFDWAGYGDGAFYDKKEERSLWGEYATSTGDTPKFILYENDDAAYTKVATGARYDVAHPYTYKYQDWVDLGVLQPWDTSLIPNFSALNPKLVESGVINGEQYFIPVDWGFIAPIINADHVEPTEESFGILFDDRYAGKISWVDTLNMLYIAGLYQGAADPFDMTDDELTAARDFLISKKPLVKFYWNTSFQLWQAFKREEVWIGYAWPDTAGYAGAAGMNYRYMQPKEGRVSWVGGFGLFKDSQNYHHAHAYVDSWASTTAAEFLLAYYYYGHTNTETDLSVVPPDVIDALGLDDPAVLEPPNAVPELYIPRRDVYQQYWSEVLAA
jgi:spermidine/putrescine transport system substrate-binding protein